MTKKTNVRPFVQAIGAGVIIKKEITWKEAERLMNFDEYGRHRLDQRERGEWPSLIRVWQDGYSRDGRRHFVAVTRDTLDKTARWWVHGSGGRVGKGGWQARIPMRAFRPYLRTAAPLFDEQTMRTTVIAPAHGKHLTSSEAARILGLSETTVRKRVASGDLSAGRTSTGLHFYALDDVQRYAEKIRSEGSARRRREA